MKVLPYGFLSWMLGLHEPRPAYLFVDQEKKKRMMK
jgi:hypothetical protein